MNTNSLPPRKTLEDWIAFYELKTKEQFNPLPTDKLLIDLDRGFFSFAFVGPWMCYKGVCGDMGHWESLGDEICRQLGITEKRAVSKRSRRAWERKGWVFVEETAGGNLFRKAVL